MDRADEEWAGLLRTAAGFGYWGTKAPAAAAGNDGEDAG
jgi:hypothetical protein